jgi:acetyl-CoA carboxylase carboxyltransferase component
MDPWRVRIDLEVGPSRQEVPAAQRPIGMRACHRICPCGRRPVDAVRGRLPASILSGENTMLRKIAAVAVAGVLAASVYAAAAVIGNVSTGTAATGSGDVDSCGNITGSTYILHGAGFTGNNAGGHGNQDNSVMINTPSDITKASMVNIETVADCVNINLHVQLQNGSGGNLDGVGFCEVTSTGGFGYNETNAGDNVPGCTVVLTHSVAVADIEKLVVTQT